ncbi:MULTISPECIES: hypothetical protein [Haloferacaceae]|uniref:Uncharacterized protein n=1 Tax=Halorubrum glutamatedens TaxID=2707018 RepID=A0ABD5QMU9_9EURY|nr:hypothetical protein [Halobellus captivus]
MAERTDTRSGGEGRTVDEGRVDDGDGSGSTSVPDATSATGDGPADGDGSDDDARVEWRDRTWYRSKLGLVIVAVDLLATAILAWTSVTPGIDVTAGSGRIVAPAVLVFSLLGALGFVFTALIDDFDASVGDLLRYNFRLPAALPLGVGIFLLSDVVLGEAAADDTLVLGAVFLAGIYVNLAYKRLGALARRLLPGDDIERGSDGSEGKNDGGDDGGDDGTDDGNDDRTVPEREDARTAE